MSKKERQQETQAKNIPPNTQGSERLGKDPFDEYFKITSFLFQEQEGSTELLEKAIKLNKCFVPALIYVPDKSLPIVDIIRQHALYENGVWRTIDTVTVMAQSDKKEFIIKGRGKWTENPKLSPDPERSKGERECQNLSSLIQAFNEASHIKDSKISIFHVTKFVSDGTEWVPVPLPPAVDLRSPMKSKALPPSKSG